MIRDPETHPTSEITFATLVHAEQAVNFSSHEDVSRSFDDNPWREARISRWTLSDGITDEASAM